MINETFRDSRSLIGVIGVIISARIRMGRECCRHGREETGVEKFD